MLDDIEVFLLQALGRAMRAKNDGLSLALYNELRGYQAHLKMLGVNDGF
jgi:hypothetical protein